MANTANTVLTTNFNVTPYYDDYNADKGFHRVLFKPGFSVQARELTQLQTILQEQVSRFGKHIFRDGSIVLPGAFNPETHGGQNQGYGIPYVKIKDTNATGGSFDITDFKGLELIGGTNGVRARVIDVLEGVQNTANTKTLYVRYTAASNTNAQIKTFIPNEVIRSSVGTVVANTALTGTIGYGSRFSIDSGVLFAKNHFVSFPKQSIILERYNPNPTCQVGFILNESIVQSDDDTSLLDPALESSNYTAPGADRFKIGTELAVYPVNQDVDSPDYVPLISFENGAVIQSFQRSQYNILRDELAKRTADESGDYIVSGLQVQLREHDNTGENFGRYNSGNNQLLLASIAPGTAYVQGYEIESRDNIELPVLKGLSTSSERNQSATTTLGSYVIVNELVGTWELDKGNLVNLRDTAQQRITQKEWSGSSVSPTGSVIGTARILSIQYASGIQGYNASYYVYLTDIRMSGSAPFTSVRSISLGNSPSNLIADLILENGSASLKNSAASTLLYYVGSNAVKSVRDVDDPTISATSYSYMKTEGVASALTIDTGGTFTTTPLTGSEVIPYGTTTLSAADKRDIIVTVNEDTRINIAGVTVSATAGTKYLNGSTGSAFANLNVGDRIEISNLGNTYFVVSKVSSANVELDSIIPAYATVATNSVGKVYKTGDNIDLTNKGLDGTEISVSSTSTTLTFNMHETYTQQISATVTYPVRRTIAKEIQKVLKPSRYVKINASTLSSLTGSISLGFSDVLRIRSIRKGTSSYPASNTAGSDVTTSFIFNNGQKDSFYDFATITPRSPLSSSDRLLVELDYFEPTITGTGAGFFTVDSYPIQDNDELSTSSTMRTEEIPVFRSPTSGTSYDLRNYLDFRPIKARTAADATTPSAASENPAGSSSFTYSSSGMRFPQAASDLTFDYTYYLGRVDLLTVDKNYNFAIQQGRPGIGATAPKPMPGRMVIEMLDIAPYPSLSPRYGYSINRSDLTSKTTRVAVYRSTMRDISVLRDRISNLEYYNALNLLEKNATDFTVKDASGLDRFKNGIFVDTFSDNTLSVNPFDFVVDKREQSIRPKYSTESLYYDFVSGSGVVKRDDLLLLSYSEKLMLAQKSVTSDLNIERATYLFIGTLTLYPPQDIWIDTKILPDERPPTIGDLTHENTKPTDTNLLNRAQVINTEWGVWQSAVTGYKIYNSAGSVVATFNASQLGQARQSAQDIANAGGTSRLETQWNDTRTNVETRRSSDVVETALSYNVKDVKVVPYMRPVTIYVKGTGLKPNTQMWCYFDNVPVSNTCTPLTASDFNTLVSSLKSGTPPGVVPIPPIQSPEGKPLIVDSKGTIYYQMRLPVGSTANTYNFRTGEKSVVLIDSRVNVDDEVIDESPDVTTGARAMFIADGTHLTKQRTVLSTRHIYVWPEPVRESRNYTTSENFTRPPPPQPFPFWLFMSCIAYSFKAVAPNQEEGIFLTSAEIFVSRKSATNGMWFEIREMSSDGNLTRNQVPFSKVVVDDPADIPLSTNGQNNPFKITFEAPVFLYHDTQYAFVVHSVNADPDTYVWVSKLGERDVITGVQRTGRPGAGTLYSTNNNLNWDIVTDTDLTLNLYRAEFPVNTTGTAIIGNGNVEKFILSGVTKSLTTRGGAWFSTGDKLTLTGANTFGGVGIVVGDRLRGNQSGSIASVTSITGGRYITSANVAFRRGERVDALYSANNNYKKVSGVISNIGNGFAVLDEYTQAQDLSLATFKFSNGDFRVGDRIYCNEDPSSYATIASIENFRYSTVSFEPEFLDFQQTSISFAMQPTSNTQVVGSYVAVSDSEEYYFNTEQAVVSRSEEIANLAGAKSNKVLVSMRTTSNVISPVVDVAKTHSIYVDNFINSNVTNETLPQNGSMINRYISKTITLAEGQDAEDLMVILTAYRPPGTDVKVWVKILNRDDSATINERSWIELTKTYGNGQYSSLANRGNFREIQYGFPASFKTGTAGAVQYTNPETGTVYEGYKYFAIKIGLILENGVTNTAVIPRVADLRCLALQM